LNASSIATIFGPLLGPIIGGFLIMSSPGWRATFWFCFAFRLFIFIVTFLFLPETYRDNAKYDVPLLPTTATAIDGKVFNCNNTIPTKDISDATTNSDSNDDSQCSDSTLMDDTKSIITIDDRDLSCIDRRRR
jgi:hypothetical protein